MSNISNSPTTSLFLFFTEIFLFSIDDKIKKALYLNTSSFTFLSSIFGNDLEMIPKQIFFTKGVGRHKEYLQSFELALRDAGIEKCAYVFQADMIGIHKIGVPPAPGARSLICSPARIRRPCPDDLMFPVRLVPYRRDRNADRLRL